MGDSLFKKLVNETVQTVEDLFITFIAAALLIFMAGQFYGLDTVGTESFWYPIWAFVIIILLKLLKDIAFRNNKKE